MCTDSGASTVFVAMLGLLGAATPADAQDAVSRVSVDSNGTQGNGQCKYRPAISDDGRYVAFTSDATNLVANDTNGCPDVFVHDRVTGATVRVSVASSGAEANFDSDWPSISSSGRYVAFESGAWNLASHDYNNCEDIFVHDRDPDGNGVFDEGNGITTRVNVDSNGAQANRETFECSISGDGQRIVFRSYADNLIPFDSNGGWPDIFLHDLGTGITMVVSVDAMGVQGNLDSFSTAISRDGNVVIFASNSTNLVAGDTNGCTDVFVHDLVRQTTIRVSVDSLGNQGDYYSNFPSISDDGSIVVFSSLADNLVAGDSNNNYDIFLHDSNTGVTERISIGLSGAEPDGYSLDSVVNADGTVVTYLSGADNLVLNDTNLQPDAFVLDRISGRTSIVSATCSGIPGNGLTDWPSISADGTLVVFSSDAANLIQGDTNAVSDVFVHDRTLDVDATWNNYGSGYAGTSGIPALTASADPVFGSTISIDIGNSFGTPTAGLLFVGTAPSSISTGAGGTILVDVVLMLPIAIGAGGLSIPAAIPQDDQLCGVSIYLQALESDPGALHRISFTPGLQLVLGQ
jgi:Tol biopolymer transport system component